jgi:hypothetical protein
MEILRLESNAAQEHARQARARATRIMRYLRAVK